MKLFLFIILIPLIAYARNSDNTKRARAADLGIDIGVMRAGALNAITDVPGVLVGHKTIIRDEHIRTGVSAILPHAGNIYQEKAPAAIYCFNSFGKLAGYTQVEELGNIETPIVLTNTLSVGTAITAVVKYILSQAGNEQVRSVNAVVGETNDSHLNDIRGFHVTEADVLEAIRAAATGRVEEGSVGAGTGTSALGYKGGIGTASRITPNIDGMNYVVGVLVQSNFGRQLVINGVPFTRETKQSEKSLSSKDGSCMLVIATDAPLSSRNLKRLAKRAFIGMGRTCDVMSNGSGDFAIAFSTAYRIPHDQPQQTINMPPLIDNDTMTIFFRAVEEATQEAIYNSLFMATTITGYNGNTSTAIPLDEVRRVMKKYNMLDLRKRLECSPLKY